MLAKRDRGYPEEVRWGSAPLRRGFLAPSRFGVRPWPLGEHPQAGGCVVACCWRLRFAFWGCFRTGDLCGLKSRQGTARGAAPAGSLLFFWGAAGSFGWLAGTETEPADVTQRDFGNQEEQDGCCRQGTVSWGLCSSCFEVKSLHGSPWTVLTTHFSVPFHQAVQPALRKHSGQQLLPTQGTEMCV